MDIVCARASQHLPRDERMDSDAIDLVRRERVQQVAVGRLSRCRAVRLSARRLRQAVEPPTKLSHAISEKKKAGFPSFGDA
jgi:hypothetical protein